MNSHQQPLLLFFLYTLFGLSLQSQLFREFAGTTDQNLLAQASQWTLKDPSDTSYPISVTECIEDKIVYKPDSLPPGTTLTKTFDNLEDHNVLRFYVQLYYIGSYTSQTVDIKFDDVTLGTSKVIPAQFPSPWDTCSSPLIYTSQITYYGAVPHTDSSVTAQFTTNLGGAASEVSWGLRNFSLVTDNSNTITTAKILAFTFYQTPSITRYPCFFFGAWVDDQGNCQLCNDPCQECYGPGSDQCFTYAPDYTENRLCPNGQTFLAAGCTNCAVENCPSCDIDVSQCDTCLTTCDQCDDSASPPQCQLCTAESNLVLYHGSCIDSCPVGMYADSDNICQLCQPGCLDCTGAQECTTCENTETSNINGLCICNEPGLYFVRDSGCTGTCLLGCEQCTISQKCIICDSGMTLQSNGDCRCDANGFYYQDDTGTCTGQCFEYCDYCHDSSSCLSCSDNRAPQGGTCKCQSPRILIGNNCECPAFMSENPFTMTCEGITLVDVVYQTTISPLFDAIFQVRMNPVIKWASPPSVAWAPDSCTFQNPVTQSQFLNSFFSQNTDTLIIPSQLLEYDLQCSLSLFYNAGSNFFIFQISFKALSPAQPQVNIFGGPLQMLNHAEVNFILAQVESSTGGAISPSDLKITWTQTSGDTLDINSVWNSSKPLQLTIPKCTLSKGKIYKFQLDVSLVVNPGSAASQEITIGVYAQKFQVQIVPSDNNYHLFDQPLNLERQISFQDDECTQTNLLTDLLDLSTAMYTWECFYIDLQLPQRLLLDESSDIANDPNVHAHPDPLVMFSQSTNSSTLNIPSSYFADYPGYQFMFYLTVTVQSTDQTPSIESFTVIKPTLEVLKAKTNLVIVSVIPFTNASFICHSENDCQAFSKDFPTKFSGSSYSSQYTYNWQLSALQSNSYSTFLRVFEYNNIFDWTAVARILYTITDGTSITSAFFTLPLNQPPQTGYLSVFPTSGDAYTTKFFLSTYGWKDTDLPVYYQFYTTYNAWDVSPVKNKMIKTLNPFASTPIVPWPYYSSSYVNVIVQDNLKSTAESSAGMVFLSNYPQGFCDAVTKSTQALTLSINSDPFPERFRLISVTLEMLHIWEQAFDSACTNELYDLKFTSIIQARQAVQALGSNQEYKLGLFTNIVWAANPDLNQDKNWILYTTFVDSDILYNSPILSPEESKLLFSFTDHQINYMKKPNSTMENPAKISSYIKILLKSTLYNVLPVEEGVSYTGDFITYFTYKTTYCKVLQEYPFFYYGFGGLKANVTLKPDQEIPSEKCNDLVDMVFMAFRANYTLTISDEFPQKLIYFDLLDSVTGKSLLEIYTFILLSPVSTCPIDAYCNPTGDGGTQIYGVFDLRNQINKIFAKSNIDQIQNIAVLADFKFWKSVAFWTVVAFSVGFLLSFYWISAKHPTYCALTAHKTITKAPLFKKINLFFWVIHPLVGIYIYNDPKTTKPIKLAIYYQRLVVVMVFSTIFSSLSKGEGWVFKGYILLFNAVTVTPVNALLNRIFDWAFKVKSGKVITSVVSLFIGIFGYLVIVTACFLIMFIIEAQQDSSQNKSWAINFMIAFVQDLSLSPALTAVNKVFLIKISETHRIGKILNKSPTILGLLLPEAFRSIYQRIFVPPPVIVKLHAKESLKDAPLSPRSTIMSPVSTTRKFLKFTTIDLQSPTQSNPLQSEVRTRIASENEIGSVDLAPMESLISNRFQTLFPEARAETIRPTSPIKQNFEKLQMTNIYSKNSITNAPTLKSSILKQSNLNTKPFQTLEFNAKEPVDMTLDEIFQFADQPDGEEIYASQLKLSKNINTINSPLRDKKKQTPISSYLPSVELALEQKTSDKYNIKTKKKNILKQAETKPFQIMDLGSSNQLKITSGLPREELSSFDGNLEETQGSQIKLFKSQNNNLDSPMRDKKKNTLSPSYLPSVELSLEQRVSEKKSKKKDAGKQIGAKLSQLMELNSIHQFKEPSGFQPDEFSSFDVKHAEETFVSLPKFKTVGSAILKQKNVSQKDMSEKVKNSKE